MEKHSDLLLHRPLNSWPRGGERKDGKALNNFLAFCLHSLPSQHKQPPTEGVKQPRLRGSGRRCRASICLRRTGSRDDGGRREHMRLKGEEGQGQNWQGQCKVTQSQSSATTNWIYNPQHTWEVARVQKLGCCTQLDFSSIFNCLQHFFWLIFTFTTYICAQMPVLSISYIWNKTCCYWCVVNHVVHLFFTFLFKQFCLIYLL